MKQRFDDSDLLPTAPASDEFAEFAARQPGCYAGVVETATIDPQ